MIKNANLASGGAMPAIRPASKCQRPTPIHRRLGRPDHHGQGGESAVAALAGKAR